MKPTRQTQSLEDARMLLGRKLLERSSAMVAAYRAGKTLQAVGDDYGITRERVRQILNRFERDTGDQIPRKPVRTIQRECARCHKVFSRRRSKYCSNECGRAAHSDALWARINSADLVAAYITGMTYREVGRRFNIGTMTVYNRIRRTDRNVMRTRGRRPNRDGCGRAKEHT